MLELGEGIPLTELVATTSHSNLINTISHYNLKAKYLVDMVPTHRDQEWLPRLMRLRGVSEDIINGVVRGWVA